jgi:hypothetical protein
MPVPDFSPGEVLTAAAMDSIGLWLVKTQTVGTAVSTQNVTSCFSADYNMYLITIDDMTTSASGGALYFKLLNGTTPITSGIYGTTIFFTTAGTSPNYAGVTNGAFGECGSIDASSKNSIFFNVEQPFLANYTRTAFNSIDDNYWRQGAYIHLANTSYNGIQFLPSGGTMTGGTIRVYGYRK